MKVLRAVSALVMLVSVPLAGCGTRIASSGEPALAAPVSVQTAAVQQKLVNRTLRVTGTLTAAEEAEVAAETAGRVVSTPVERGSQVGEGTALVGLAPLEAQAQALEAEANVAQLEARLALVPGSPFNVDDVPEVKSAMAARDLGEADFGRIKNLLEQRVVSQAEYDQRRAQADATRNQYATARNAAQQQYRLLEASRARASLARKALADTVVRAPFAGLVVERKVSVGDFVTRGTKVVTVVRVNPLRVELTVPEQSIGLIQTGQPVRLTVDAYPGRTFEGRVRFVAPSLRVDQRAMVVEALVDNDDGVLKPGMFAAAQVELAATDASLVVPTVAVQAAAGVSHVFVVRGDRVEQRMVTPGMVVGDLTEIVTGLNAGDTVAVGALGALSDGARITVTRTVAPAPAGTPAQLR
jgi:RND family efflux transporter MFP subunit